MTAFSHLTVHSRGEFSALEILTMPRGRRRRQDEEAAAAAAMRVYIASPGW